MFGPLAAEDRREKYLTDCMRAWLDRGAVVATMLVVVSGSVYGVVRFSIATGGLNWFQQAWDEPFYFADILDSSFRLDTRSASRLLGQVLLALGVRDPAWIILAYDLVFPTVVVGMAYLLSKHFATQVVARLAWAIALVFSFDLLSFSSYLIFPSPPMIMLAHVIGDNWLFAVDYLTYFNLYRTPEPQVSWVVFFAYLYLLVRYCDRQESHIYYTLCCLNPLLATVYNSVAIVSLLLFTMVSVGCILLFHRSIARSFIASLATTGLAFWFTFTTASTKLLTAQNIFATHLPILRPSIIYSLCGLAALVMRIWHRHWVLTPRDLACACLFIIPLITLNQQIITGRAVHAQQWEYYINYICIMAGAGLLLTGPRDKKPSSLSDLRGAAAVGCWLGLLAIIARGHLENVRLFAPANVASLAQARAYAAAVAKIGPIERVVTSHLFDDALFLTRVPQSVRVLGSDNWLMLNPPPPMVDGEQIAVHLARSSASVAVGFEVLARRGTTPAVLEADLNEEISSGVCWPALVYFFAYIDCWNRWSNYRSKLVLSPNAVIEPIVAEYREYLNKIAASPPSEPTLVLASQPRGADIGSPFQQTLVSQAKVDFAGSTASAYFYLQTAR
jgi:hypothetical protein